MADLFSAMTILAGVIVTGAGGLTFYLYFKFKGQLSGNTFGAFNPALHLLMAASIVTLMGLAILGMGIYFLVTGGPFGATLIP